jgi:hypothetical protein
MAHEIRMVWAMLKYYTRKITWPNIETFYYFQSGFTDLQGLNFAGDVDNWMG